MDAICEASGGRAVQHSFTVQNCRAIARGMIGSEDRLMPAGSQYRGNAARALSRSVGAYAAVLAFSVSLATSAWAVDVPFKLDNGRGASAEGVGRLENGHFNASGTIAGRMFTIDGDINGDVVNIRANGGLGGANSKQGRCVANGSASPATGKVSISIAISCASSWNGSIVLELPAAGSVAALAMQPAATPSAGSAAATTLALDPIDEVYVAVKPAKVRERPDVASGRIKTIGVGEKIIVMGKLKGQDWYQVSENDKPLGFVIADQLVPAAQYRQAATSTGATPAPGTNTAVASVPASLAPVPVSLSQLDFGRYEALVIGNNAYANGLPGLKTATGDAQAVAQVLRSSYGMKVTLLLNATRGQIIGALAKYRQLLTWDDNLLIYYAGHGSYDQSADQGYWLPVDAAPGDPSNWVSNTDITSMLKAIQARHVMVVADSCYSGTLTRDADVEIKDSNYIQRMVEKKARTVMTSGGLEPVADSGGSGHSVFAAAFIAVLQRNPGVLDAQAFFAQVREPVVLAAPQTPEYSNLRFAGHEGGDFVFVRKQ
jgi:hypothetical protein